MMEFVQCPITSSIVDSVFIIILSLKPMISYCNEKNYIKNKNVILLPFCFVILPFITYFHFNR